MKITMYELIEMIKDGKAPKKIKIDEDILNLEKGKETLYKFEKGGGSLAFGYYIDNNKLNDEVEIIEEEKKIPEKIDIRIDATNTEYIKGKSYGKNYSKSAIELAHTINEIIDYLNSKGDE